ncbi:MAG: ABC transporter substrate-binding protein [Chloroflexota bacterium]|nr:ABC transporter substrate-binding protein [Chloroflexota bacterium]
MASFPYNKRERHTSPRLLFMGIFLVLSLLLVACGSNSTDTGSGGTTPTTNKPTITAPTDLITAGTLTVGSDTTYPPQEYQDPASGKYTGFDVDLITEMANRMGLKTNVVKANFDTILDDLTAKRYDVVISAITINPERQKKADFVPYFQAGESLLVKKGNPKNIKSISDLCGLTVGVQNGTVEQTDLVNQNKQCGSKLISLTVLKDQTEVINLLANGRVDATYQDSPVTDLYIKQHSDSFDVGGSVVNAAAEGIAVRKGDTSMLTAMQQAFKAVKDDGTYDKLFKTWTLSDGEKISFIDRRQNLA